MRARYISSCEPAISAPSGEAQRHRVEAAGDLRRGNAGGHGCVHEARAVEMHSQAELTARRDHRSKLLERPDGAAGGVVRVLERQHRRPWPPEAAFGPARLSQLIRRQAPSMPWQTARLQARVEGGACELGDHNVRSLLDEELAAALAEDRERDLVAHRRGG